MGIWRETRTLEEKQDSFPSPYALCRRNDALLLVASISPASVVFDERGDCKRVWQKSPRRDNVTAGLCVAQVPWPTYMIHSEKATPLGEVYRIMVVPAVSACPYPVWSMVITSGLLEVQVPVAP